LIKTREENKGFFSREDIKNKIDYDPSLTIKLGLLIAVDINNNIYCEFREVRYSEPQVDNYKMGIFNNARELIGYISLCKDSVDLIDPKGRRSRYIYVDYYSGNVYQICTSEAGASLVVWEAEREE